MSESSLTQSNSSYTHNYRQGRRRWVPRGVMLLAVLFVVGLLSACEGMPDPLMAAIAVPAEQQALTLSVERCVNTTEHYVHPGSVLPVTIAWNECAACKGRVNLNVF